jgi:hypothetical protein
VFVADKKTGSILQSDTWHPALHTALRRYVRRPFRLDVLIVPDYDAKSAHRTGADIVGSPSWPAWWTSR